MPQTLGEIKALLSSRGLHPRKRFGQNFLIDHQKLAAIVEAAGLSHGDRVLEVGPGTGVLTEAMLETGASVIAAEVDRDMCAILSERLGRHDRFTLIEGDAMDGKHALSPPVSQAVGDEPFWLIANLPYNIASPLLATLVLDYPQMRGAVVMVQREVGDRLTAEPGGKDYGPLTVTIGAGCEAAQVTRLSPGCFWPAPQVESVVVKIVRRAEPLTEDLHGLAAMTQRLFQQRRKQIGSVLGRDAKYPDGVEPTMRAEQLGVKQLVAMTQMNKGKADA